ncbi:nucleoside triphosphate pyrophosphohydrolase [Stappia taiwanensis]|uniref:Nucleoside triphosphate pyrophosphohydrolase n=1 Tax=Stappia taiwanensis TaxID=992267 RepID=A0A838XXI1_9HYPH|nr:nucleoside triphosphate pyrophosphohydrolase [Stappia taiwanensis]MBA4613176.1 nucleoside triphosphate pyrophosphohydrolase [Stappia taiwanensis]GGE79854.1 nucleoside triphosphate pyrophosphohydrolase [Stappia taiwanensis]
MQPARDIQRLIEIMAALRTPGTGCPWDLEQDFGTIAPYTIEEAYEVADAIARGDMTDLREELGDLLLQVVYHARIAEEDQAFVFADVVEGITAKMIRRHPHVFGDEDARSAGMAKGAWERIKQEEKRLRAEARAAEGLGEEAPRFLDAVPPVFPALTEAEKLQRKASRVGFDWGAAGPVLDKIREEVEELADEVDAEQRDRERIADEIGDMIFALANLARHLDIDPEEALKRTNRKFRRRFAAIEDTAAAQGVTLDAMTLEEMEAAWQAAKRLPEETSTGTAPAVPASEAAASESVGS